MRSFALSAPSKPDKPHAFSAVGERLQHQLAGLLAGIGVA